MAHLYSLSSSGYPVCACEVIIIIFICMNKINNAVIVIFVVTTIERHVYTVMHGPAV